MTHPQKHFFRSRTCFLSVHPKELKLRPLKRYPHADIHSSSFYKVQKAEVAPCFRVNAGMSEMQSTHTKNQCSAFKGKGSDIRYHIYKLWKYGGKSVKITTKQIWDISNRLTDATFLLRYVLYHDCQNNAKKPGPQLRMTDTLSCGDSILYLKKNMNI